MYKEEKDRLRKLVRKEGCENETYKKLEKEAKNLDAVERKRVYQELKRDYEIGVPIDKIYEVFPILISCFSLVMSGYAFASQGNEESCPIIFLCGVLAVLVAILIAFTQTLYGRKRELRRLLDFFEAFNETEERRGAEQDPMKS